MDENDETYLLLSLLQCVHYLAIVLCNECVNAGKVHRRRWWVRSLNKCKLEKGVVLRMFSHLSKDDDEEFFRYTSMKCCQFRDLLDLLAPHLKKNSRRAPLPPAIRLAMTLKYLAHGGKCRTIAKSFNVGASTVQKVIPEVCKVIWTVLAPIVMQEPNENDWLSVSEDFWKLWNFPNCLGAIDGKHVRCHAPPNVESLSYQDRKYFSIVLLAAVNAKYEFLWVDIGDYDHQSGGSVFANSVFGRLLHQGAVRFPPDQALPGTAVEKPFSFVADASFPLKETILRPYPTYPKTNLGESEKIFNYRLNRARRTVGNAFDILSSRWRIFQQLMRGSPETVTKVVQATTVLHNYVMKTGSERYVPQKFVRSEDDLYFNCHGEENTTAGLMNLGLAGSNNASRSSFAHRNALRDYFVSDAGAVSWQRNAIYVGC